MIPCQVPENCHSTGSKGLGNDINSTVPINIAERYTVLSATHTRQDSLANPAGSVSEQDRHVRLHLIGNHDIKVAVEIHVAENNRLW